MKIRDLLSSKVTRNASWIIAGRVYHMLLAFFVGLLTARYLGPSNFGLINYAATYTSFFASFCTLGINSVIVKNFVDHPDEEGETVGSAIVLRTVSSVLSVLILSMATLKKNAPSCGSSSRKYLKKLRSCGMPAAEKRVRTQIRTVLMLCFVVKCSVPTAAIV